MSKSIESLVPSLEQCIKLAKYWPEEVDTIFVWANVFESDPPRVIFTTAARNIQKSIIAPAPTLLEMLQITAKIDGYSTASLDLLGEAAFAFAEDGTHKGERGDNIFDAAIKYLSTQLK
jgi:hypothetical protein